MAYGFVAHSRAYLRDPWNWVDFTVVARNLGGKGCPSEFCVFGGLRWWACWTLRRRRGRTEGNGTPLSAAQVEALSFLKPARVLRPLRSLSAVCGLQASLRVSEDMKSLKRNFCKARDPALVPHHHPLAPRAEGLG